MVAHLKVKSDNVKKVEEKLLIEKKGIEDEAAKIAIEKEKCTKELAEAMPALERAAEAAKQVDSGMVAEFSGFKKQNSDQAKDIVKIVIDAISILFYNQLDQEKPITWNHNYKASSRGGAAPFSFIKDSFDHSKNVLNGMGPKTLQDMAKEENSNLINDEILELLEPYMEIFETECTHDFAKGLSQALGNLRYYCQQVYEFSINTRVVKPKKAALDMQKQMLDAANRDLDKKNEDLNEIKAEAAILEASFNEKKEEAEAKEEEAKTQELKINKATTLITSLADEESRWSHDAEQLAILKESLVGNVGVATAFISYCGPFNAEFRDMIANTIMISNLKELNVPFTATIYDKLTDFLVYEATVGQ